MRAPATAAFVLAFVAALILRWPIASHDVEHYVGPDEGEVVENVLEMAKTGDFDHRHRGYPGLHFYLQLLPVRARRALTGDAVAELPRADFYLTARRVTLVAGLLSAAVLFAIALRILPPWPSLLAACLVLFSPLAFRESAVVNPDLMLSLFATAALFLSLRLVDDRSLASFLAVGAFVGLAAAVKYTGGFALASFVLAFVLGDEPRRHLRKAFAGLAAAAFTFAAASPYSFVYLSEFVRGLGTHAEYYQASSTNGLWELGKAILGRGLGPLGGLAAFVGALLVLRDREPRRLVLLGFPLAYLLVFAFFGRAFPRHALPLLPSLAFLAADACSRIPARRWSLLAGLAVLAPSTLGTAELFRRTSRPSPADRAAEWASSLAPGTRVLEDQFTPYLAEDRFRVHRLQVEERVFPGNFDWVFYSGYPPGLDTTGLREAARFETDGALGDPIVVFQVPARESLMEVTLARGQREAEIGAGELPFFGDGWEAPTPGAFGTERLSRGESSELFFVMPAGDGGESLQIDLYLSCAVCPAGIDFELNGSPIVRSELASDEPFPLRVVVAEGLTEGGLNRFRLRYQSPGRLDRRHRTAAVRFYQMRVSRSRE
jgi:hypothetical protein